MKKKKNAEQENPTAEEQETETPAEQEDTPEEETPDQEDQQETEGEDQEEPAEGSEGENADEGKDDPQEGHQDDQPSADAGQEAAADENAALREQLLQSQCKLAAYAAGVAKDTIDDAVTLAMAEAAKSGEVTEAAVTKAMEAVLKRHPEWKAEDESKKKTGGFKLGADRDSGGNYKKPSGNTTTKTKRWNRFK